MAEHALLSASGSKRWLNCPPSVMLEKDFPDEGSVYAEEGTLAHAVAEETLDRFFYTKILDPVKVMNEEPVAKDMLEYVQTYADYVIERFNAGSCSQIYIENKLDFSPWVPEGFGTGDAVIVSEGLIEIIDLKYGKGVPVSATDNSQMMLYALGAYNGFSMLFDFDKVRMTIVQPRLDSISTCELSVKELLDWGEAVKQVALMAYKGEGEFSAGEHCRFCKARFRCKHLADYHLALARHEFMSADLMSDEDVSDILKRAPMFENWLKGIKDYALSEAVNNDKTWPGFKLVEGTSKRFIPEENAFHLVAILTKSGFKNSEIYKPVELQTITNLEKLCGKKEFNRLCGGYVLKPEGKPTLVQESDKREPLKRLRAQDEFKAADAVVSEKGEDKNGK